MTGLKFHQKDYMICVWIMLHGGKAANKSSYGIIWR